MEAAQLNFNLQLEEEGEGEGRGEKGEGKGRLSVEVLGPCSKCQFNVNKFIFGDKRKRKRKGTHSALCRKAGGGRGVGCTTGTFAPWPVPCLTKPCDVAISQASIGLATARPSPPHLPLCNCPLGNCWPCILVRPMPTVLPLINARHTSAQGSTGRGRVLLPLWIDGRTD